MSEMAEEGLSLPTETGSRSSLPPALAAAVIPVGAPCERCRSAIAECYFVANGRVICQACRERLQGSPGEALALGAIAALLSAAVYYVIEWSWDVDFVLVAVLAGALIGLAVRRGAKSSRAPRHRWLAVALTYVCVVSTYIPSLMEMTNVDGPLQAGLRALYLPFLMLVTMRNPVTLILLGFGLHEAWKLSAPPVVNVDGPFLSLGDGSR